MKELVIPIFALVIVVSFLALSGCASLEGDGYANGRGYSDQSLCVKIDKRGNQVWFNCRK